MKLTITKVSALVLAMCMCFTGCQKKPASIAQLETRPYITEQQVNQIENMTIYVYNEESSRLESRVVQVTVYPDQTRAEAVLNYLMSTEDFEFALNSYDIPDYTLSIAGSIAKVQIKNKYSRSSGKNLKGFALHYSIVNTLCSIDGIDYVSVYAGDSELAGSSYVGPSRFLETSLSEHYSEYRAKGSSYGQYPMLLYYGDVEQSHVIPVPNQVYTSVDNTRYTVTAIMERLSKSPSADTDLTATVADDVKINEVSVSENIMTIDFNKNPCPETTVNQAITYGSLFKTLTALYPEIDTLRFTVGQEKVSINGTDINEVMEDTFTGIVGGPVTLYMAQTSTGSLYPVNRYLSTSAGISVNQLLSALADGPGDRDGIVTSSPFLGGLTINNVITAKVVNDVAIVNFDTGFYDCVKAMSPQEEALMIYGIVNTLTAREQINSVQFLINNQNFDTINGHIYYTNPLIANPGLTIAL